MLQLSINGIPICNLDPDTAAWLTAVAARGPGILSRRPEITVPKVNLLGASPLAGGSLAYRTFQEESELTLKILFTETESVVQNTWAR